MTGVDHLDLVERLSGVFGDETDQRDPRAEVPWPQMPDVRSLVEHVGSVQRWVADIVRTRRAYPMVDVRAPSTGLPGWYADGRAALIGALSAAPPDSPCWILGGRTGTVRFWRRRMIFEHVKHLIDLRASGGGSWAAAPELGPEVYADGIDELLAEFLPRSRPTLPPLPGAVRLEASDSARAWRIGPGWTVDEGGAETVVAAATADLALLLWERADPAAGPERFRVQGSPAPAAALRATSIHPW